MNITERIANHFGGKFEQIIRANKEIQFYVYGYYYYWKDSRFMRSLSEHDNKKTPDLHKLKVIFKDHLDSLTKEYLEKTKDELIKKHIGELDKPEIYFQELKYLNTELSVLNRY